jgi:hypothetical protein
MTDDALRQYPSRITVSLDVEADPESISARLGIEPTRQGRAGEAYVNTVGRTTERILRRSYWSLYSSRAQEAPLEEHVSDILAHLMPRTAEWHALAPLPSPVLYCTVIRGDTGPELILKPTTIRQMADLGLGIEIVIIRVRGDDFHETEGAHKPVP